MVQSEHYHVGIIVPDLVSARAHFEDLLGVVWGPLVETDAVMTDRDGNEHGYHLRLCLSTVAPYLELIEEVAGSPWECNEHSNLHHIGFWSDSVEDDSRRWSASGCPFQVGSAHQGELRSAYHEDLLGIRLEVMSSAAREMIEQMCAPPNGAGATE